jgi:hypothetical protein
VLERELEWIRAGAKARQAKSKARIQSYEEMANKTEREKISTAQIIIPNGPRLGGKVIEVEGEGEWNARKHGGPKRRVWRKIHIGIDEETLEVRAVEVTSSDIGDAPMLPELLAQIPADQDIASVTADGAYDTRKCHDAIAERGANAVIPPRENAKPWKAITAGAVARNEVLRASKYLGRALWRRWSGYHRRSRAETKMHCVKLLGQRLKARDFDRQVAEFQVRVAVLNGFTALGIPVTKVVG